ncbi:NADH-quinone oxidoreductase subunit NuoE [Alphaproteobacteria bacterium]|nr:NADH-quinone oxidoreductase subunit NuoE [Alphaproteobacteria bacterium]
MSGGGIAAEQPASFAFTAENEAKAEALIAKYPEGRQQSAVMALLDLAQRQHDNWIPMAAIDVIGAKLEMAPIRVLEVATFYSMYNMAPVGAFYLQACRTTPCWLRGSDNVIKAIRDKLGIANKQMTDDGKFSLLEVECLGACANAPVLQVNDDFYEDLDYAGTVALLDKLAEGEIPTPGSTSGRTGAMPAPGATSLTSAVGGAGATGDVGED